jgi:hypothetical protein
MQNSSPSKREFVFAVAAEFPTRRTGMSLAGLSWEIHEKWTAWQGWKNDKAIGYTTSTRLRGRKIKGSTVLIGFFVVVCYFSLGVTAAFAVI